jgi:peptide/nickel transport system substrate-binding protein
MGVSAATATFLANAGAQAASGKPARNGFAFTNQDATPAASPVASPAAAVGSASTVGAPDAGTAKQTRGAGSELRALIWQAPTIAAPHSALSDKDYMAAAPVIEPVLQYLPDGTILPNLVEKVPTVENGLLKADLTEATFVFLEGLTWSDKTPVTANDLVFTWKWVTTDANQATSATTWATIKNIVAKDDRTAVVTFNKPAATWFEPFSGNYNGNLYPAHVFKNDPTNRNDAFLLAPIGTGPYVLSKFTPNDSAEYSINENYRDATKPYFKSIAIKGGGDATSAARAVLQTGDYDYAWNVQVTPDVLNSIAKGSKYAKVYSSPGTTIESLNFNFSDPNKEVDGQKSQKDTPHPLFSQLAVRQALNASVDRQLITDKLYQPPVEHPTANLLAGLPSFDSPNTRWEFDIDKANQILDAAGWTKDGNTRSKDGVKFSFNYWTSISDVRQKTQAIVKADWAKLGASIELDQVDGGVFFSGDASAEQNFYHMYWDLDMWTNGPYSALPFSYMNRWYAGPNGENIAQKENGWAKDNTQRYNNPDYDALYEKLLDTLDPNEAAQLLIKMNDLLIADVVEIPIVVRAFSTYALANRIRNDNLANGPSFVLPFWNIANWNETDDLLK